VYLLQISRPVPAACVCVFEAVPVLCDNDRICLVYSTAELLLCVLRYRKHSGATQCSKQYGMTVKQLGTAAY